MPGPLLPTGYTVLNDVPQEKLLQSRSRVALFAGAVLIGTVLAAFILPFLFPPHAVAYSQSYVVGFNNRVATALILLLSLAVLAFFLRAAPGKTLPVAVAGERLRWPYLAVTSLLATGWIAGLSKLILMHTSRSIEDFTTIPQMQKVFYFHRVLYSQVEFAYGPLLFYPTLWLARLLAPFYVGPVDLAYYITLLVDQLLGESALFYVVNRLPLTRITRALVFCALSVYTLMPLMGLNYTLLRFVLPMFSLVLLSQVRDPGRATVAAFLLSLLLLGVSPELALPFLAGVTVLVALRFCAGQRRAPWLLVSAAAGCAAFAVAAPPDYLRAFRSFSAGYNYLVLLPRPEVLLLLLCAVWLVPSAVARRLRAAHPQAALLAALYASSLALLPAALGCAEILHVVSNGLGFFLLAALAVSGRLLPTLLYAATLLSVQILAVVQMDSIGRGRLFTALFCGDPRYRVYAVNRRLPARIRTWLDLPSPGACPAYMSLETLRTYTYGEPFVIPWATGANTSERLALAPEYLPSYFHGTINVSNPQMQMQKVAEMRVAHWAVIYFSAGLAPVSPNQNALYGDDTHFHALHQVYADDLMLDEVRRNWTPVATLGPGPTALYHRIH